MTITLRELKTDQEFEAIFSFIRKLNDGMTHDEFLFILGHMRKGSYYCVGAYDDGGVCLGICGYWIEWKFWCKKAICLDHLVVDENARGRGIGKMLIDWAVERGREAGCHLALLDTYVDNYKSHKLYAREDFEIWGYHFVKELKK